MKTFIGLVMALVLLRVQGEKLNNGNCVDEYCFTVHTDMLDFNSAQKSCKDKGGYLMTVKTTEANKVISDLLAGCTGHFWIGLRYTNEFCAGSALDLKGYTWITGDKTTNFTNWKSDESVCSQRCVSLSKDDPKWTERLCNDAIEGYLCEYKNTNKCGQLTSESPVLYETPFGFVREDLREVPHSSNATRQDLGTKYICLDGGWLKAPWNCEVYKGGCEHNCYKLSDKFICTCLPGYKLESNAVSCSKAHNNPCLQAGCSQVCLVKGENYVCQCRSGFELGKDGKTCKDIDDCNDKRLCPGENSYCVNTAGGFECRCKNGFKKEKDTCEDDDECVFGPCEHMCNNTIGSYNCECSEGYKVSLEDRHKCILYCPQWECLAVACDLNNPFQCDCPRGFILEERLTDNFCIDIDECEMFYCDQNCKNTAGGYICSCNEGFDLIGNTKCAKTEGSGNTTSFNFFTPTSRPSPTETASFISAGGLLGITVCTIMVVFLMVCVIHHTMKRCGKIDSFTVDKGHNKGIHTLQQVTTEKYTKNLSITNINYKTSKI